MARVAIHPGEHLAEEPALRLAHFFGTSAEFWLNLQSLYELRLAEARIGKAIKKLPTLKHLEEAHT
jgi:plasmid maintenance system antidote protein VapI